MENVANDTDLFYTALGHLYMESAIKELGENNLH